MVGSLIAASVFGLTAGTFAYVATAFVVNYALSQVVIRTFGQKPSQGQVTDPGMRQQIPPNTGNPLPIVYGDAYLGGTFVDAALTTDQKTMYYVMAVSCISPNGTFNFDTTKFYYGDRLITFDSTDQTKVVSLTDDAGNVDTTINGYLYINLYTSTNAGVITNKNGTAAPSTVMGASSGLDASLQWTGTRQMNGLAFAILKLVYSREANTTQLQPITYYCSQYLNGQSCARPGDVWYDYITNPDYGGAIDSAYVNAASRTALNTYSDQTITFTNSSGNPATQPRYRINGVLNGGETVLTNIDRILECCDSWMTYNAATGQWAIVVNKAETPTYLFNDQNIIGELRVSATDITSQVNQVEAQFPFKDNRDQSAFVFLETPSGLLLPNEPVNKYTTTFYLCNDSVQASYLANRILEQAREDLIVSFNTTYYGIQVDAGDVIYLTNLAYNWTNKPFRVVKVNEVSLADGSLGARIECTEYSAAVYDDQNITQYSPVPNSYIPSPTYWSSLSAPTVTGYPTATFPNFSVQVFVPNVGRTTLLQLFYTTNASPSSTDWKLLTTANLSNATSFQNNTYYTFTNLVLDSGTYYFAYNCANNASQSALSSASSAFVWSPIITGPTGPTGPTGAQARIMYARIAGNPTPVSGIVTVLGDNKPTGAQGAAVWGASFNVAWSDTDPNPLSNDSLYQSDGIYNGSNTAWSTPYISSLKVGALSAVSTNTGSLTVSGTIQSNTAAISGTTMTGSGGVLYSSGNFAFGNSTTNISFNGTQMTLNGNVVATGNINLNAVTIPGYVQLSSNSSLTSPGSVLSTTLTTGSQPVVVIFGITASTTSSTQFTASVRVAGSAVKTYTSIDTGGVSFNINITGVAYVANPGAGSFTVEIYSNSTPAGGGTIVFDGVTSTSPGCYFYVLGTKR